MLEIVSYKSLHQIKIKGSGMLTKRVPDYSHGSTQCPIVNPTIGELSRGRVSWGDCISP
jgi:hypothetical protein